MNRTRLSTVHTAALRAFYESLPESVNRWYLPFPEPSWAVLNGHLAETEQGRHISLGILGDDGTILGHAFILHMQGDKPVFGIGLQPEVQGQGWGRRLMAFILAEVDRQGVPLITLTVVKSNGRAQALYEKMGFLVRGAASFRKPDDSYYMERRLNA